MEMVNEGREHELHRLRAEVHILLRFCCQAARCLILTSLLCRAKTSASTWPGPSASLLPSEMIQTEPEMYQ